MKVKIISDGGVTVGGYRHHQKNFQEPIIKSASLVENAVRDAYWIDFHDQFSQHEQFLQLVENHPGITLRHEFWGSLNAVTVDVKDDSVLKEILDKVQGIRQVEPVVIHERPDVAERLQILGAKGTPDKMSVHDVTGVKEVHESMKLYGKGIKIGIIDSGVDYTHPALGGCFGPGCKVAYGTDLVGDDGRTPDNDPKSECDGHGTHVAGIIAAKDISFVGVAPEATLGAYRVFGCSGGTSNDLIMKALLKAAEDGMQVINLSLGGPGGWRQDREAYLADQLVKNGTIIVAAMGNEGQMGLFEASSPGVAGGVITVASTENEFRSNLYFTVKMDGKAKAVHRRKNEEDDEEDNEEEEEEDVHKQHDEEHGPSDSEDDRPILFTGAFDMDLESTTLVQISPGISGTVKEDACGPITQDLKGKVALIRRGDCTFKIKTANAALAGAVGVIFMDNVPSAGFAADTEGATIKVRTITLADGEFLLRTIQKEKKEKDGIKLLAGNGPKKMFNPDGGTLSLFSSMGPDSELNSKPDVTAPGGQIWSTFPIKLGSYASLSGTSMATPYIVGCVALYLEARPHSDSSAEAIKTAFQNVGQPRNDLKSEFKGFASVTQQGAGLISMMDVLSNQATVTPARVSLNDTLHINAKQTFTITNRGTDIVQYTVEVVPAAGLLPFDVLKMVDKKPKKVPAPASVKISQSKVIVGPGATATVDMTFRGPATDPALYVIYSGFVRFTPDKVSRQTPVMHVPYMGMQGDFKSVHILDPAFGLRMYDALGRPLGTGAVPPAGHAHVGTDGMVPGLDFGSVGEINHEIELEPGHGVGDDSSTTGRPWPLGSGMKIVFRMITASEILMLDLVSDEGSDPYQVKSYGLLKNGIAKFVPRNDQVEGNAFQVMSWDGELVLEDGSVVAVQGNTSLSANGMYRLRISLLKHFGNMENDLDFEAHMSAPFSLR
ncbi:hypothetical protein BG006_007009 [Podila minutissima]|uniref:Uncharacterized protein n=1 Tax=Podila minutissima TaxID=64525 RepID=A0A9P5SSK6_9FUNG|nr:hypothetical protein BG006_007009 [Podila minutissima]